MNPLQLDGDMARRFLDLLDPDHDTFLFAAGDDNEIRARQARKDGKPAWADHRHGSIDAQLKWLSQQQAQGWGIFTTVQRMKGKRRLASNVGVIRAVFHEWDTGAPPPNFALLPSLIVETSTVVDANGEIFPKLHSYWFVDREHPISADDFHGIMERMVETHGSDPDAKDLARVLRLPGTWHQKGEPHQVRIVGGCEARYTRIELLEAFPPPVRRKPDPKAPRPTFNGYAPPGLERFTAPLKAIPADAYGDCIKVGQALHHEGGGSAAALTQWDAWCATSTKWQPGWCEEKWATFRGQGRSGGTIFGIAEDHGYSKPAKATKDKAKHLNGHSAASANWSNPPAEGEASAQSRTNGKAKSRIDGLEFDDEITVSTKVDAIVKGVLHPGDIAVLYGQSGVGKTFTATDLAYHVARGQAWHGRRVKQSAVLFVGLEGARGLRHRMAAYAQHMGSAGCMLARMTTHTPLDKSEAGKAGEAIIIEQARRLAEAAGHPVGLIIIDTLARAIAGDDENAAQDMSAFVGRLQAIARETGAAVLVLHHPGKDDARGMRGSTALFAACDAVIKITANGNTKEVATEKVKEGVVGSLFTYRLRQVSLGVDEDGDEITSCIVEVADSSGKAAPARPPPESQRGRALGELEELDQPAWQTCPQSQAGARWRHADQQGSLAGGMSRKTAHRRRRSGDRTQGLLEGPDRPQ